MRNLSKTYGLCMILAASFLVSTVHGSVAPYPFIRLTVNGEDVDSIALTPGDPCTIEVVSDGYDSYVAYIDYADVWGEFVHIETTPEAGDLAMVDQMDGIYHVMAFGVEVPPSPGVHFVFEYYAWEPGQGVLLLYDYYLGIADMLEIYVGGGPGEDYEPPTPDPMTWACPPAAAGNRAITMAATTAYDPSGVEYYFQCVWGRGHDSGWQDSPRYTDISLQPNTRYAYRVKARDYSEFQNETAWSESASATTRGGAIHVDDSAPGRIQDGASWETAFTDLQDALAVAGAGDQILVAQGVYTPAQRKDPNALRTAAFQLIDKVTIRGGYAGFGHRKPNARHVRLYETILSGDINGDDVGDLNDPSRRDNCYHVVTASEAHYTAVLDGFTITAGNANDYYDEEGGGLYMEYGSPTVTNCTFKGNFAAAYGGAIFCLYGSSTITNCTFSGNKASDNGGGMFSDSSNLILTDCTFSTNHAGQDGGGMFDSNGELTLTNCVFSRNSAAHYGGGVRWDYVNAGITNCTFSGNYANMQGGGIYNYGTTNKHLTAYNCTFSNNTAEQLSGGGLFNEYSNLTLTNCFFFNNTSDDGGGGLEILFSSPTVTNCTFIGNSATASHSGGGAICLGNSSPLITNCTFRRNTAGKYGGGICAWSYYTSSSPTVVNCILWGDTAGLAGDEIALIMSELPSSMMISYSDVEGGPEAAYVERGCTLHWDRSNIVQDPLFKDAEGHLWGRSPCRNAGDPEGYYGEQTDMDGEPRVMENCVDIGADELPIPIHNITQGTHHYTIQEAISKAENGDTIIVRDGIYKGRLNRNIDFLGKAITLRSSDPSDPRVVAETIIDCQGEGRGFVFQNQETSASVLDGFTIIGGMAWEVGGGGILCDDSSPTIGNCVINANTAQGPGGGIACYNSSPIISNCTISNNSPDGVYLDEGSTPTILGNVQMLSNDVVGEGSLQIHPSAKLNLDDSKILCGASGPGTMRIEPGDELIIGGDAIIDLGDPEDPNIRGTIDCDGLLQVKDNVKITNARLNVTRATFEDNAIITNNVIHVSSRAPYGQFFIDGNATVAYNDIYADGDRYMDLDPSIFEGEFVNNRIFVTITEGVGQTHGGLFELRGRNGLVSNYVCEPNGFVCEAAANTIPDCNLINWTIERLELVPGAKVNLTNRFGFQPPYDPGSDDDVLYVKELILREGSVFNTAFNRLYYGTLTSEPDAVIRHEPLLGFSLINIAFDDAIEFLVRVAHNNFEHPENPDYNREHVKRIIGEQPDPNGMMEMCSIVDGDPNSPSNGQVINAQAKGVFSKASEGQILVMFEYMFVDDPCREAELVVYLSDDPELGVNLVEIARIRPPARGRPGSVGSGLLAVFSGNFPFGNLDFYRGTYIQLELRGTAARCWINNLDPSVACTMICGNYYIDPLDPLSVDIYDYLMLLAEFGLAPVGVDEWCLDVVTDGCINNDDLLAWDVVDRLNLCPTKPAGSKSLAFTSYAPQKDKAPRTMKGLWSEDAGGAASLVICGKPSSGVGIQPPSNYVYSVDTDGTCTGSDVGSGNSRLVTDGNGSLYQIDSELGLIRQDTGKVVVKPKVVSYGGSTVSIGFNNGVAALADAVFKPDDPNIVYVVPVQVDPQDGNCPYTAAAKLELTGDVNNPNYNILELYGKNPATDPCQMNEPNECVSGCVYEPDVHNLHEIEVDSAGNYLFVLSANWCNANNWILIYDEAAGNSSEVRVPLSIAGLTGPTAMVVSSFEEKLYLASSVNTSNDLTTEVYRFLIDKTTPSEPNLVFDGTIDIGCPQPSICSTNPTLCDPGLGYVSTISSMTENLQDGTLCATGFTAPKFPAEGTLPYGQLGGIFTTPMLAVFSPYASGQVQANTIGGCDLALPFSIVWAGARGPEKCGGADLNQSGRVSFPDFAILAIAWLSESGDGNWNPDCDLHKPIDYSVNSRDLAILAEHWLESGCLD